MKIFISWSEIRSLRVAVKLKAWLPYVLPYSEPWLSSDDIRKGSRWQAEMSQALQQPRAGILVLTRDNLNSRWLHFEAGAISKAVEGETPVVCTYLVDVENAEVGLPLGMFQNTQATRDDTLKLLSDLNRASAVPIPHDRLAKLFDTFWPELEAVIAETRDATVPTQARREQHEILEEILETVRGLARGVYEPTNAFRETLLALANQPESLSESGAGWLKAARNQVLVQEAAKNLRAFWLQQQFRPDEPEQKE